MKRLATSSSYLCIIALALIFCYASATFCAPDTDVKPETSVVSVEAEAEIVLVAPHSVRVGELVRLDVSESTADNWKWSMVPGSDDFLVYDSGGRAVFSARKPGTYQVFVSCAKNGSVDHTVWTITVIGPPDIPTSDSFVELIPYWMWDANLPTEECTLLADSFESVAARYNDLPEQGDWIKATAETNRVVLGDRVDAWSPILDKIGKMLLKKAENGELTTPEEHKRLWLEIAAGLRAC